MKQIPIKNQWNVFALVDDDLYDKIISFGSWRLQQHGGYAVCGVKSIKMHWLVVEIPFGMEADHIDKNPLNNQRNNLRVCTHKENSANQRLQKRRNGKYKGVEYRSNDVFIAYIKSNQKKIHLGCFKTPEDAAKAYDKKAIELFGQYASTNF